MIDLILWAICGLFVVWEIVAHFVFRNRQAHTLSNRIWALEKRHRWTRGLVFAACVVLLTHLTFQIP